MFNRSTAEVKQHTVSDLIIFFCISPAALLTLYTDGTTMSPTTEVPIVLIASALSGVVGVVVVVLIVIICLIALWKKRQMVKERESGKKNTELVVYHADLIIQRSL